MPTARPSPPAARRSLLLTLPLVAVTVVVLVAFVDVRAVAAQIRQSDLRWLAAASFAFVLGLALYAERWRLLLDGRPGWLTTLLASALGLSLNLLAPLRLGEPARIVALGRRAALPAAEVASSVVVERLWEQGLRLTALGAALVVGVGAFASPASAFVAMLILAALIVGLLLLLRRPEKLLAHLPRWLARLPRVQEASARQALAQALAGLAAAARPRRLLQGGGLSLLAWLCFWACYVAVLLALPSALPLPAAAALSLAALALVPPSAPTAPGLFHASLVAPLALLGYPAAFLTAFAVVLHALLLLWVLPLGLLGFLRRAAAAREPLISP